MISATLTGASSKASGKVLHSAAQPTAKKGADRDMRQHANLTKKEAAVFLRVHPRTLERWVNEGRLSPAYIGDHTIVFPQKELDRFIADSMKRPRAA